MIFDGPFKSPEPGGNCGAWFGQNERTDMDPESRLFTPLTLRALTFKNRIFVSPMCQYTVADGVPGAWHLVHLGSRAVGGAALVMAEATAIRATGRISLGDTGLWNDAQMEAFKPITRFIRDQGAHAGIQLAHAGRKASTGVPWEGGGRVEVKDGGWIPEAPSAIPFSGQSPTPKELDRAGMDAVCADFVSAARRAQEAGFDVVELHMAHGYLLHEFLSPLSNRRTDDCGGSLANRMRFPLEVAAQVRAVWPAGLPLFVRISATDWAPEGGWDLDQSVAFAKELKKAGVDLVDCSSGGTLEHANIPAGPGYQVPFAARIRGEAGVAAAAVGFIVNGAEAELILREGSADAVFVAREFLRDPYFPLHAAQELGAAVDWPKQYGRGKIVAGGK